jgi:uncharacterized surface protein with fasciclin (FAS1) repeats
MRRIHSLLMAAAAVVAVPTLAAAQQPAAPASGDIVVVATQAGTFNTLLQAATAAGLVETLKGAGPFTVFAPTDEAFAKLPAGTVEALLADREALRNVLLYHVVPGRIMAADVVRAGMAHPATVQGQTLNVRVRDGKVLVDGATVVAADVNASNGVIHVIDTVVTPRPANGSK